MKTLVCSDVHDDSQALAAFADYAQTKNPDRILFLGDFSLRPYTPSDLEALLKDRSPQGIRNFVDAKRKYNEQKIKEMKKILDGSQIPYNVIPGNYDPNVSKIFDEKDLHGRTSYLGEAKMLGYGGADAFPPQIHLLVELGEIVDFGHQRLYDQLIRENPEIVISHNPPRGLCDDMFNGQNVGTPAISQYISQNGPKLVLSGHVHEAGPLGNNPNGSLGVRIIENGKRTIVVNPGNLGRFELVKMPSLETQMTFPYGTFVELDLEDNGDVMKISQYTLTGMKGNQSIGEVEKIRDISF